MLLTATMVGLIGLGVWWGWLRSPTVADLRTTADELAVPRDWVLLESAERGRGPLCVDVSCPSVYRRWQLGELVTRTDIEAMLDAAGWEVTEIDGDCRPIWNATGSVPLCEVSAEVHGFDAVLWVIGPVRPEPERQFRVTLTISP